ncbi:MULTISPECIES: class I adenylate-forming enzyme family protein [Rhodococcus]|uniref:class I adenylate-forming enzyme family protein n=1 Tax=Rhodococcus TaxID=1827 RepID=UPI0008161587|nr:MULTISPECIES: AMP-binding protein [Rhodococcus]SCC64226.1 fatty-acyl-CoA synthase [Rhodococcus qingshengii]
MTMDALPGQTEQWREELEQRWQTWTPRSLAQVLDHVAGAHPDRPMIVTDERTYTYADVTELSTRLAAGLHSIGIRTGDHVAVVMANYPHAVALKFAVARLGAVSVSVNFMLRHRELGYVLGQSRSKVLITMDEFRGLDYTSELDQLIPGWVNCGGGDVLTELRDVFVFGTSSTQPSRGRSVEDLIALGADVSNETIAALTASVDPDTTSDLLYTSGTTGKAKGVTLSHDGILRTAYSSAYTRALSDGYRIMYALPLYHVFGYVEATVATMFVGGSTVPKCSFSAADMLAAVAKHKTDEIMCVPAMTSVLLEEASTSSYDLSSLTTVFSSGSVHAPGMFDRIRETLGVERIFTAYGQTETTASTMCTRPDDSIERLNHTNGAVKPAGIAGDPELGGTLAVYKVVDPVTGVGLPAGEVGELLVRGPIITRGYYDMPEQTADLFTEGGWMRTGDLGRLSEDGYLTLTGRQKESYRFGGELVIPSDIEGVLIDHPGVLEAHVVGLPHERWGEVGCAWVVANPEAVPEAAELIDYCSSRLARFKVPAVVYFVDAADLPRTVTGRVQKFRLVERAAQYAALRDTAPTS